MDEDTVTDDLATADRWADRGMRVAASCADCHHDHGWAMTALPDACEVCGSTSMLYEQLD